MPYVPRWPHKRALAFASTCALMLACAPAALADSSTGGSGSDATAAVVNTLPVALNPAPASMTVAPVVVTVAPAATTVPADLTGPDPSDVSDPYAK